MIGLLYLVVGVPYLVLLLWATRKAYRWARSEKLSNLKSWLVAAGAFLVVYLPVFWDLVPTLAAYGYSCATEAGFWEHKTIAQWKKENPGVAETLVAMEGLSPVTRLGDMQNYTDTYQLNQRFSRVSRKTGPLPVNRWRWEYEIVDRNNGEVLARSVDFSAGNGLVGGGSWPLKFWLQIGFCEAGGVYAAKQIPVREAWKNIGRKD